MHRSSPEHSKLAWQDIPSRNIRKEAKDILRRDRYPGKRKATERRMKLVWRDFNKSIGKGLISPFHHRKNSRMLRLSKNVEVSKMFASY